MVTVIVHTYTVLLPGVVRAKCVTIQCDSLWSITYSLQGGKLLRENVVGKSGGRTVILDLGVGMSTVNVLRLPNEDMVKYGRGNLKRIRTGLDRSGVVDWNTQNGVWINGDVGVVLYVLLDLIHYSTYLDPMNTT